MKKGILVFVMVMMVTGAGFGQAGNWVWARQATSGNQEAGCITTDAQGNVHALGMFGDSIITFGSTTLTISGNISYFMVKYDATVTNINRSNTSIIFSPKDISGFIIFYNIYI